MKEKKKKERKKTSKLGDFAAPSEHPVGLNRAALHNREKKRKKNRIIARTQEKKKNNNNNNPTGHLCGNTSNMYCSYGITRLWL